MPNRFIFRQVYYKDLATFLSDGEIRAKNSGNPQACHQTSYQEIVDRRGSSEFPLPGGGVVNNCVPFYFSPITSFTYTICRGNVPLVSPNGEHLGQACEDDRIFLVSRPESFRQAGLSYYFSNYALNSNAPVPSLESDLDRLEDHIHWSAFDEAPCKAKIPEIGYEGVCSYFLNMANPPERMNRSQKRMAEFLVRGAAPLQLIECIIAKSVTMRDKLMIMMDASEWEIPIYVNRGCYFK